MSIASWIAVVLAAATLAACSDQPGSSVRKADVPAWQGADPRYTAPGWKVGDAASWEAQMRNRAQAQNEYNRSAASP